MTYKTDTEFDPSAMAVFRQGKTALRRYAFVGLALLILLSPAPGQLFGQHSAWLREWVMYSGVGVGLPKGLFVVHDEAGIVAEYTPLAAAGLDRYPQIVHYYFPGRIAEPAHLARFATDLCAKIEEGQRISFTGDVGTRQGWMPMSSENVCDHSGEEH